jgi:hypothetical protein
LGSADTTQTMQNARRSQERATGVADLAQEAASATVDAIGAAADRAQSVASEIKDDVVGVAERLTDEGKKSSTRFAHTVSGALDAAAQRLDKEVPRLAREVRQAARGVDRMADDFDRRSVGDILRSAADFAHRQPTTFIVGATLAGFLAARFLKSTPTGDVGTASSDDLSFGPRLGEGSRRAGFQEGIDGQ